MHFLADMYVEEVKSGICDGKASPNVVKETPATAYVAGNNAIGTVRIYCLKQLLEYHQGNVTTVSLHRWWASSV